MFVYSAQIIPRRKRRLHNNDDLDIEEPGMEGGREGGREGGKC